MYVDAYMERSKSKEILHVAERINGKRILRTLEPLYEFYLESEYGDVPTLTGKKSQRFEFNSWYSMKKEMEKYDSNQLFEGDVNVTFKTLAKEYTGCDSPDLNLVFFDIETDFHKKFGYADPSDPFNRITAISLYQSWTDCDYVLCMAPSEMETYQAQEIINTINADHPETSQVILYTDEKEMLMKFFELIEDGDVLSGWNSEFFDIPYMINRTKKLFGDAFTSYFCLWHKQPTPREADNFGKKVITYDLIGRVHLDYLALYKKHAGQVEQSYKLDYIGEKITGETKVPYEGSLDSLYRGDFERFIRYSKQDSILLKKINDVMDFISLHNRLAHQECVPIKTTMGSVALIDTAINNLVHKRGQVVFNKRKHDDDFIDDVDFDEDYDAEFSDVVEEKVSAKAAGAWVQDPVLGLVDDVGVTDFNSLYPSVLRALGMSTECIIGQVRQTHTEKYLDDRINEQRIKSRSKSFKPNWTEAWHGLFASVEFTMIHEKSKEQLIVDFEDGTSLESTGEELYNLIFSDDSTIVMSANGTLFDKTIAGVIPEILTIWYTERKQQQKMVLDYKHLSLDGLEVSSEMVAILGDLDFTSTNKMERVRIHYDDPVFKLRNAINTNDVESIIEIIYTNGMVFKDGKIFCNDSDRKYCKVNSAFWKQNQQIRKILLNSLYGALLNTASTYYDRRLGQSVTLTGRSMTKHMAGVINEVTTGKYDYVGGSVIYGDSVIGETLIDVMMNGEESKLTIRELYNAFSASEYIDKVDKEYVKTPDLKVKTYDKTTCVAYYDDVKNIMRHKNTNSLYDIKTETSQVTCTSDHSVMVEVDGELGEYTPKEIIEMMEYGCEVYMIEGI